MKKITILLLLLLLSLAASDTFAATIRVVNYTATKYSMGYDSWFLGIKSSYSAEVKSSDVTEVYAPFMGSFGEIRIFKKGESSNPLWTSKPYGIWLPTRRYIIQIMPENGKTTFSLTDL